MVIVFELKIFRNKYQMMIEEQRVLKRGNDLIEMNDDADIVVEASMKQKGGQSNHRTIVLLKEADVEGDCYDFY